MTLFHNILLIQLGDIGDVVLTTPTIRAVKETYPDARVSVLVRKPYGDLLLADPNLYEVLMFTKGKGVSTRVMTKFVRFVCRLRRAHYDLVVDLRTGDRGTWFSFFTGAPERVAYKGGTIKLWHKLLLTNIIDSPLASPYPVHPGANQSLSILRSIGIDTADSMPRLNIASADLARAFELLAECGLMPEGRWVTINPFSRWKYKEWDHEKWGDIIDRLWEEYRIPTVLIGSREEAAAAAGILDGRDGRAFNLAGETSLGELAAVVSTGTLHLGVDSAAPHIAAAVGTPTVTIFGPGNWKGWTVTDALHRVVVADLPCVPCNRKGCEDSEASRCLDGISGDDVWRAVRSVLKEVVGDAAVSDRPAIARSGDME